MHEIVFDTCLVLFCLGFVAGIITALFVMAIPFHKLKFKFGKKKKEKVNESKQQT